MTNVLIQSQEIISQPLTVAGLTEPMALEFEAVRLGTLKERRWYEGWPRYQDDSDIRQAIMDGTLHHVPANANLQPIQRLANPNSGVWCYLGGRALAAMVDIGKLWRNNLNQRGLDPGGELRLAFTSLVRTERQQQALVASGKLALADSTHPLGVAFDLDASSYYRVLSHSRMESVHHPGRNSDKINTIREQLRTITHQAGEDTSPIPRPDLYDRWVTEALLDATDELYDRGRINRVIEFEATENQVVHVAVKPETNDNA